MFYRVVADPLKLRYRGLTLFSLIFRTFVKDTILTVRFLYILVVGGLIGLFGIEI